MTPMSASVLVISVGATQPNKLGPIITPASISPTTAGWRRRSKISAVILAAASIIKSVSRTRACPWIIAPKK